MGIDLNEKLIVFSDALNLDKAIKIKKTCDAVGIPCKSFLMHIHAANGTQRALE